MKMNVLRKRWFFVSCIFITNSTMARDYFNPEFFSIDTPLGKGVDISYFETGGQAPGKYLVDIVVNDRMVDAAEIDFFANEVGELTPCLSVSQLEAYGVKIKDFPGLVGKCSDIAVIPNASSTFLFAEQKLILSIPQASMSPLSRGYVSPALWDEGISAAQLNYSLSGANVSYKGNQNDNNSHYANLRPGLNIGPWRLRNYTTWVKNSEGDGKWDNIYTYVQRDIEALKSSLTVGDGVSPSYVFDATPFRGAQLQSEDAMLPDSLKGYAPIVRGIARTNAQVIIRQNGYVIYQSAVPPGSFEISDMYPTGGSGDLNVQVKEADGRDQVFVVPFASLPVMQREGQFKYSVTAGEYRSYSNDAKPHFGEGTLTYGLGNGVTAYGGTQVASNYKSLAAGVGLNMGEVGAISSDITHSMTSPEHSSNVNGQSLRVRYSKNFNEAGTNLSIAGYRYSTSGYYGMQEFFENSANDLFLQGKLRDRTEFTLYQTLGGSMGSVSLSAVRESYWNYDKPMQSYSVGYNNSWGGVSYGLTYVKSKSAVRRSGEYSYDDQSISLSVSIPFERVWASYGMNSSRNGHTTNTVGVNGTAFSDNSLNWGVQQGYSSGSGNNVLGDVNANYKGSYGEVYGGYGYDSSSRRFSYGMSGGVLVHSDGITASQQLSDTVVLIKAPGADGVAVTNQTGVKTDYRGYTVLSGVSPYRENDVTLDTSTFPDNVDMEITSKKVVPTKGAISRVQFSPSVGYRTLLVLRTKDGEYIPFGSMVSSKNGSSTSIAGDRGEVYITGLSGNDKLTAQWGNKSNEKCDISLNLDLSSGNSGIFKGKGVCL